MIKKTMRRIKPTAINKVMDLLALRDHSELEIQQKLSGKFEQAEIDQAIQRGKSKGWLPHDEHSLIALSEKAADELHRKKKGILYINSKLAEKGLPEIQGNPELELEKALNLIKNKYSVSANLTSAESEKQKAKLYRHLLSRGFEMSLVRKVINEKY